MDVLNVTSKRIIMDKNQKCGSADGYSLFGDSENRENNYLKIRDLLSIALFNILRTHYLIHI